MTAIALEQAYQSVGDLTGQFSLNAGPKSISSIKKAICLTTEEENVNESKELVDLLLSIQKSLPTKLEDLDHGLAKEHLETINANLAKVNAFLETVKQLFDDGADIEKDDDNFINLMANMQLTQKTMSYISDYLTLILKIHKNESEPSQDFSLVELLNFIKAA